MQRNAIAMLYDRVVVLVKYITGVIDGKSCNVRVDKQEPPKPIPTLFARLPRS